jgi:cell division protein FtsQ
VLAGYPAGSPNQMDSASTHSHSYIESWRFSRPGSGVTSKSYTNRTTLWDDQDPADSSAPQPIPARGAWRAPSAVLAGDRLDRNARRIATPLPPVEEDTEDSAPIPRRTRFAAARTPWWRPRTNFGRILLGTAAFIVLALLVTSGILVRQFLVRNGHFRIPGASSIQTSGLSEVNRAEVLPVFGEDIGRNIFFVSLSERRKQLEAIPWVQQATVMRFLPDRLSVSIVERTPVAFVREGAQVELADADGVILSMPPVMMAQHHYSFPVITGINASDALASRRARMALYQKFVAELDQNNQHLTEQVSEIDLSDPEDLRATMPEQGSDILAHFGDGHFLERLQIYKSHIAEWRQRYPKLIGVDLRYNGNVPLEMSNDGASVASVQASATSNTASTAPEPVVSAAPPAPAKTAPATAVKLAPAMAIKPVPAKTNTAARKAAEAKKRAAKLKAAKLKAAHEKAVAHPVSHNVSHPAPSVKQGQ